MFLFFKSTHFILMVVSHVPPTKP